ncbi:MAG: aspartate kinase [Eubacteriales bacterium]|nr:aspartate kinase [Eubacteriales bacterium]
MALIVQKFGGTSVANTERLFNVADIVTKTAAAGNQVVVVVSAQGDTTDDFIEKAGEITNRPPVREMDVLLSAGEQISMALLAMAIDKLGFHATSLTGWQAGIHTDLTYGAARIRKVEPRRIRSLLERNRIVIVAGFQGINSHDSITTLGRGGSDTTAVAIAAALGADLCQIYTDVDGVYTADPRIIPDAKKLDEITYDEMLELATLGAQVLHNRSVEMAKKYNIDLEVISSLTRNPGTKVKEVTSVEKMMISGVACDKDTARVAVMGIPDEPGKAFRLFSMLSAHNINIDIILQSIGHDNTKDISFTVAKGQLEETIKLIEENKDRLQYEKWSSESAIAKLSIVGAGMTSTPGVAAKMFEALSDAQVNIRMISTSEIKISVLISEEDATRAMRAVHDKFFN